MARRRGSGDLDVRKRNDESPAPLAIHGLLGQDLVRGVPAQQQHVAGIVLDQFSGL